MKLPFSIVLNPVIKPYFGESRQFCLHPTFALSVFYTYFHGALGLIINVNHIMKHLGEVPVECCTEDGRPFNWRRDFMLIHDLKIIATSMSIVQYACLLIGCVTENPALFLPHLTGQVIVALVKFVNIISLLGQLNLRNMAKLRNKFAAIAVMAFNWFQEFCVFRQLLCICDL